MKILIISGAGLLAGTHIYNELIKDVLLNFHYQTDSEFPEIILYNFPFKSIDNHGYLNEELALIEISSILKKFPDINKTIIACNTLHLVKLDHSSLIPLPKVIIDEFNKSFKSHEKGLVLCSEYSRVKNLFSHSNLQYPSSSINVFIDSIINNNIGFYYKNYVKEDFNELNAFIKNNNISYLLVTCTELSMMPWCKFVDIPVLDSAKIAIQHVIESLKKEHYESI